MAHADPFALAMLGTTTASFVTGLAGFAFGLVAAAIWLYALTPNRRAGSPPVDQRTVTD
jgi:hypothetical protein